MVKRASNVNAPVTDLHRFSALGEFSHLPKQERQKYLSNLSLSISFYGVDDPNAAFNQLRELGFTPVRISEILLCMAFIINAESLSLPTGKKNKQQRGSIAQDLLNRMRLQANDENELDVIVTIAGTEQNVRSLAMSNLGNLAPLVQELSSDTMILGRVIDCFCSYQRDPLYA
ncbi:MAG: hypothetical protein ACJ8CB_01550 [Ktedonobacteraceae bacterium]